MEVLLYIVRNRGRCFHPLGGNSASTIKYLPRLLPMLEWLEAHMNELSLTVGNLARQVGVSEVYLRVMFRQIFGVSPVAYVRKSRIQRACTLLCSTQMSVKEIASQTGFIHETFFDETFRKLIGMSPTRYRAAIVHDENLP